MFSIHVTDFAICSEYRRLLPLSSNGFLRNWSFTGTSFPLAWFDPVSEFLKERRGPEFEFVDTELETDRKAMIDRLNRLDRLIGTVAKPVPGQSGWYRIPIEWLDTRPAHYSKMAERFDTITRRICANYDTLIRAARRKLDAQNDSPPRPSCLSWTTVGDAAPFATS
jgi:hypothetical protein